MKRPFFWLVLVGVVFTAINLGHTVRAYDPPDFYNVSGSVVTIGDSQCSLELNTETHVATIRARNFHAYGINEQGIMNEVIIKGQEVGIGDVDSDLNGVSIKLSDLNQTLTLNPTP